MEVIIYQPTKTAMQSGRHKSNHWLLESIVKNKRYIDPIMGWNGNLDTSSQLRLVFDNKEAAIKFAQDNNYVYHLKNPTKRRIKAKNYADNLVWNHKTTNW